MADRRSPRQPLDGRGAGEMIADQPQAALGVEPHAVEGDDAGRLLAAMLQRVQAERGDRRRVGVAENAEDAAFLAQPVAVGVEAAATRRFGECGGMRSRLEVVSEPCASLFGSRSERRRGRHVLVDQGVELLLVERRAARARRRIGLLRRSEQGTAID